MIDQQVGAYRLVERIGTGGMGDVYKAVDVQTGETVAVKVLKSEVVERNPEMLARFKREGELLRELHHPNIVTIVETLEEGGQYYLVIEYVSGGSLYDLLVEQGRLALDQTLAIALELADALTRAHHLDIIHRDIKPANVLLAEDGTPRLTDFGVAYYRGVSVITEGGMVIGTYAYLSPEACMGKQLDGRTDIWSFGVLLFEMLAGEWPFGGSSPGETITAIMSKPAADLSDFRDDVPDNLLDLIYRMLDKNREARIPSVRLVGAELEAIIKSLDSQSYDTVQMSVFAPPTPLSVMHRHNLPVQTTPFIGREDDLDAIEAMLGGAGCRLVTLLGPGGMGKTRLALEVAARQLSYYVDGVFLIPFAPLSTPAQVLPAVADAINLSFSDQGTPEAQLLNYLREKSMLLIVDNFEHIPQGGDLIGAILDHAPHVSIIATSRVRLNLKAEYLYEVGGMPFPEAQAEDYTGFDAVRLFVSYARHAQPDYVLAKEDRQAVAEICRLVGGMPLGLELAAAWVRSLPPDEIAEELANDIDFLETEMRDLPERHRSLRAVFNYSWALLQEHEREALGRLSVFRGGFTRDAAKTIAGARVRTLAGLVDKSLLQRTLDGRYVPHGMVSQFAEENLEDRPEERAQLRDLHGDYYAGYLERQDKDLRSNKQLKAIGEIVLEFDNIRAAWEWAVMQGHYDRIAQMIYGLTRFLVMSSRFQENYEMLQRAAAVLDSQTDPEKEVALGLILTRFGVIAARLSHNDEAGEVLRRSIAMAQARGDRTDEAFALQELGNVLTALGQLQEGWELVEQSNRIFGELGDQGSVARGLYRLGFIATRLGRIDEALQLTEACLALSRKIGDKYRLAGALSNLGAWYFFLGIYDKSIAYEEESLALWRQFGNSSHIAHTVAALAGTAMLVQGDAVKASQLAKEGINLGVDAATRSTVLYVLSLLASYQEDFESARQHGEESLMLAEQVGNIASVMFGNYTLGVALIGLGEPGEARSHVYKALQIAAGMRSPAFITSILPGMAMLAAAGGDLKQAAELLGLVRSHPASATGWLDTFPMMRRLVADLEARLTPAGYQAALERGRVLELDVMVEALLEQVAR